MEAFLSGNKIPTRYIDFSVNNEATDVFGIEIDSHDLSAVEISINDILILKTIDESDILSKNKYLLRKHEGIFNSTETHITIASLKFIDIGRKRMVQVSYTKPEKRFRPERIEIDKIEILGEFVEVFSHEN